MHDIPAIIFAGGKSSRMGTDKALLPYARFDSLAQFQQHKLSQLFTKIYISAKNDKFNFDCLLIKDKYKESSPLLALITIFETLAVDEIFVLSVDAPLVDASTIKKILMNNDKPYDAIIPQSPSGTQPLCAIYKRSILRFAHKQIERDNHRLISLLDISNTRYVAFNNDEPFTNLNTPEEYKTHFI